jgi:hypothetical protein
MRTAFKLHAVGEHMNTKFSHRWFTVARFEDGYSADANAKFRTLASYGLTPQWATEAPCKSNPLAPRALLIQLPKVEAEKYRSHNPDTGMTAQETAALHRQGIVPMD